LIDLYDKKKLPNKILLSGEKGIGKSTLAYHLINYILSLNEEFSYDRKNYIINEQNKSYKLIQNQTNLNFHLIDIVKDKKNIDINQIRDLIFDLNKSSFNTKPRFVLIDNIELLNINSINALLKILEEPNKNIIFILINNNKKILPTLKSRCLNYKVFISYDETIEIINKVLDRDIFELINKELINYYTTPGQLYEMVKFSNYQKINLKDMSLKEFLSQIIQSKAFKKEKSINEIIFNLIELYLRKKTSIKNVYLIDLYKYFLKRINDVKIYNLDTESLYMEFEDKVLNG
jgi:DNA polymerase-3 subunit delta'